VLDSFRAVGQPLPGLASPAAIDALIKALNTTPAKWWDEGPVLDMYLHPAWSHRLLTRLTGLAVVDSEYAHFSDHDYFDTRVWGPKWQAVWEQHRRDLILRPIAVPDNQPFRFEDEDRRLICADLDAVRAELTLDGPLLRKRKVSKEVGLTATFVISLTNAGGRPLTFHTKPALSNTIKSKSATSGYASQESVCVESNEEFATLLPGKSIRWRTEQTLSRVSARDRVRYQFHMLFQRSGKDAAAWRGVVDTPFVTLDAATPLVEEKK
jgi:hypothetical protein